MSNKVHLNEEFITVLDNFSKINIGAVIEPAVDGNQFVRSIGENGQIFAEYNSQEVLLKDKLVYAQMPKFISTIKLMSKPAVEIESVDGEYTGNINLSCEDYHMAVSLKASEAEYIHHMEASKRLPDIPELLNFALEKESLDRLKSISANFGLGCFGIRSVDGVVSLYVFNEASRESKESCTIEVESGVDVPDFDVVLNIELMQFVTGDYSVSVKEKAMVVFTHSSMNLKYTMPIINKISQLPN